MAITSKEALAKKEAAENLLADELLRQSQAVVTELRKDSEGAPDEPPPEGQDDAAPPAGDEGPDASASADTPPPLDDSAGGGEWTIDEAVQALQAMSPDQLAMWSQAMEMVQGGGADGGGGDGGGDMPPPDAMKSELAKMEQRLAQRLDKAVASLAKSQPAAKPQRRAATGPTMPATKPAAKQLNKAEIDAKLLEKAQDRKTSAADRQKINDYQLGRVDVKAIAGLLKE